MISFFFVPHCCNRFISHLLWRYGLEMTAPCVTKQGNTCCHSNAFLSIYVVPKHRNDLPFPSSSNCNVPLTFESPKPLLVPKYFVVRFSIEDIELSLHYSRKIGLDDFHRIDWNFYLGTLWTISDMCVLKENLHHMWHKYFWKQRLHYYLFI